ncbi:MAG: hypothetical protein J5803_00255, partial [Desulfovibrio sp.]|nr:hypothetical protein [Desulfovibrio sp.]
MDQSLMDTVFGAVLFDEPGKPCGGWYALGDGEVQRFDTVDQLPEEAVYITNLGYEERKAFSSKSFPFLLNDFLREEWTSFFGCLCAFDRRITTGIAANCFTHIMRLTRAFLDAPDFLPVRSLRHGLYARYSEFERLVGLDESQALLQATYYSVNCSFSSQEQENVRLLSVPWRSHCKAILECPLPFGPLKEEEEAFPLKEEQCCAYLEKVGDWPGLFKVSVRWSDPDTARLLFFGADPAQGPFPPYPFWIATPDLLLLQRVAKLTIHQSYLWSSKTYLTLAAEIEEAFPIQADLSLSSAVFFDNIWHAMACRPGRKTSQSASVLVNPLIPFIRAMDRCLLFAKAKELEAHGVTVLGYANGRL